MHSTDTPARHPSAGRSLSPALGGCIHSLITSVASLLLLLMCAVPAVHAQNESPKSVDLQKLPADKPLTIDGTAESTWEGAPAHAFEYELSSIDNPGDLAGTWKATWDDTNLYLLITAEDDVLTDDNTPADDANGIRDDSPEIYLDANNSKDVGTSAGDCGYDVSYDQDGSGIDVQYILEDDNVYLGSCSTNPDLNNNVDWAETTSESGYVVEVAIPWATLGVTPQAGDQIGIEVMLNDDDDGDGRDGKVTWNDPDDASFYSPAAFGTATLSGNPLPVELSRFTASLDRRNVVLSWATVSETNNDGFAIERRIGGHSWRELGFVDGAGTSRSTRTYQFSDRQVPRDAPTATYRLRQIDVDGSQSLSKAVTVSLDGPSAFALESVYPTPAQRKISVQLALPEPRPVRVSLYDVTGRRVATLLDARLRSGVQVRSLTLPGLSAGAYVLRVTAGPDAAAITLPVVP